MPKFLDIVQQEATMDEDKVRALCSQKNVWDYFGIEKDTFRIFQKRKRFNLQRNFTSKILIILLRKALI